MLILKEQQQEKTNKQKTVSLYDSMELYCRPPPKAVPVLIAGLCTTKPPQPVTELLSVHWDAV